MASTVPDQKKKFEMTADKAPVIKPASLPKYIAVITTIAVTGLNPGTGAKRILPITDSAIITAINIIFFVSFSFFS